LGGRETDLTRNFTDRRIEVPLLLSSEDSPVRPGGKISTEREEGLEDLGPLSSRGRERPWQGKTLIPHK